MREDDPGVLLDAVEAWRDRARPLELILATCDAAASLGRRARAQEAVPMLETAAETARRCGAKRDAARVDHLLRAAGRPEARDSGPRVGWDAITPGEVSVLRLVVEGLSNAEIAERLSVSRRTVDSHLHHVYTKVGARSRVELSMEAANRFQ
jgi:DNA-binding CsgD family transcriptional regulator